MAWRESASHVPVLVLVSYFFNIKNILEIGAGELSTKLFLDIYPKLDKLVSVEEDEVWYNKLTNELKEYPKLKLIKNLPYITDKFDLLFIDGPQDKEKRQVIIDSIYTNKLLIIHDINEYNYENEGYVFDFISPMTGVYSSNLPTLEKYNSIIADNFWDLQEDWFGWKKLFDNTIF